jgi:hypothetical protein
LSSASEYERTRHDPKNSSGCRRRRHPDDRNVLALDHLERAVRSRETVIAVKSAIPWGFLILIPALAAAGGSGFKLSCGGGAVLSAAKAKRMPLIAANGILVLIPSALFLASKARAGTFDTSFYAVQALETHCGRREHHAART